MTDDSTDPEALDVALAGSVDLRLPVDVDPDEAAAISAAVSTLIRDEELAAAAAAARANDSWDGARWRYAGRLRGLDRPGRRVPRGAPTDAWTASGRTDRF